MQTPLLEVIATRLADPATPAICRAVVEAGNAAFKPIYEAVNSMINGAEKDGLEKYIAAELALQSCIASGAPTKQSAENADLTVLITDAFDRKPAFDKMIREMKKRATAKGAAPLEANAPKMPKHPLRSLEKKCVRTDEPGSATKVRCVCVCVMLCVMLWCVLLCVVVCCCVC